MAEYQPGQCNIGPAERTRRRYVGYLGFLVGVLVVIAVPLLELEPLWLFVSAAPFYGGFLGVLQSRARFCAGFGLAGVYDVTENGGDRVEVADPDDRSADRRKSVVLQLQAVVLAVTLSGALYAVAAVLA